MKVFQAVAPKQGAFIDVDIPDPAEDQILAKVCWCGVCGTDYDLFSGDSSFIKTGKATYPIRLGHEWSGIVVKVGSKVTKLKLGDRVVGDNYVSCGKCEACLAGNYNECTGRSHVGTINPCWNGAFAEYYLVPERHVYPIAENISLREAALCEPFSVAYGGTKKMDIGPNSVVAVIGTGSIAFSAAALALCEGAEVYVIGRNEKKLQIALKLGVSGIINSSKCDPEEKLKEMTGGRLANYILECSGSAAVVNTIVKVAAPKAVAALIGFYNEAPDGVDFNTIVEKELTLIGIMGEYGNLEAVTKIMAEKEMNLSAMITDEKNFDEVGDALSVEDHSGVVKTVIKISEEN